MLDDDTDADRPVAGHPRAPDHRGHRRRHLRLPLHAGLRPGQDRHPGRLRDGPLQARVPGHGRQVQVAGRTRAAAVGQRHALRGARPSRPVSRRTATSACRSAGNLLGDRVSYAVAWLNGSNDGASSDSLRRRRPQRRQGVCGRAALRRIRSRSPTTSRCAGWASASPAPIPTRPAPRAQPLLPSYRTPAQATFFRYRTGTTPTLADGERTRFAPQFYYYGRQPRAARRIHGGLAGRGA